MSLLSAGRQENDVFGPEQSSRINLDIRVGAAEGTAPTALAAFDAALRALGVGDVNLIRLSSVIPPGSSVSVNNSTLAQHAEWGDRLYCVYAEQHASERGQWACAGIGWTRKTDGDGSGLFVEHHGHSEEEVSAAIGLSLDDMTRARGGEFEPIEMHISSVRCDGAPVCALVLASYASEGWARS